MLVFEYRIILWLHCMLIIGICQMHGITFLMAFDGFGYDSEILSFINIALARECLEPIRYTIVILRLKKNVYQLFMPFKPALKKEIVHTYLTFFHAIRLIIDQLPKNKNACNFYSVFFLSINNQYLSVFLTNDKLRVKNIMTFFADWLLT